MIEERILVHAPRGRDADVVSGVLANVGIETLACTSESELLDGLAEGAAAAIITEECITDTLAPALESWLALQETWSDFQFIVLANKLAGRRSTAALASLNRLGNIILLERPLNAQTLASAGSAALRARSRQYAARRNLREIHEARGALETLNAELEYRIASRTRELAGANDRLMTEIAERERAQAALFQAQKMEALGRLTGGIAHDFNNVLHAVSMNLEIVERLSHEPRVAAIATRARAAIGRGASLTGQLLSFARNQSLLPRQTNVNELLAGIKELVTVSVGPGVAVDIAMAETPLWAVLDATQLEMAVLNLAVNARDAMPSGGRLSIEVKTASGGAALPGVDRCVVVSVSDTGTGIPATLLGKVFEPFYSTKPLGRGTGLGLSQVYGFAKQSGGAALIQSEPGAGTVVRLYFPLATSTAELQQLEGKVAMQAAASRPRNILVVEDDPDVRRVIVDSLAMMGHRVTDASDGAAGLTAIRSRRPDLMVIDYAMPGMTGVELIAHARREIGDIPVILATGYADMAEVDRVMGTQSVLIKPFQIGTLTDAVNAALAEWDARHETAGVV